MDLFDIFMFAVLVVVIGAAVFGVKAFNDYKELRTGGIRSDASHIQTCHGRGMQYHKSVDEYAVCYVSSPLTIKIYDTTVG